MQPVQPIAEGQETKIIYTLIKDQKYKEAINYLNYELQFCPKSRALSLLAYCHQMNQDFTSAVGIYEQLVKYYPEIDDYKIYLAQSYYKDSLYDETLKICASIENPQYQGKMVQLQALIRYEKSEFQHAKTLLKQNEMDDPDSIINEGCILFKEKQV